MKKDNIKDSRSPNPRLRIASINLLHRDKISDEDENPSRESQRPSRADEEKDADIPHFYHHPRRPRNFDPL